MTTRKPRNESVYLPVKDGQWIQPRRRGYKMACCGCGLIHVLNFRVVKRRVQFQAFRNNRATGQFRRWHGITVTRQ